MNIVGCSGKERGGLRMRNILELHRNMGLEHSRIDQRPPQPPLKPLNTDIQAERGRACRPHRDSPSAADPG